jgi:threonine synthase
MPHFTHLECTRCGKIEPTDKLLNLCSCGGPFFARYDLNAIRQIWPREALKNGPSNLWRYAPVLPVQQMKSISLGEGWTPLLEVSRLRRHLGLPNLWIKDESPNVTASFKARAFACDFARQRTRREKVSIPSAGNAGSATAAYAAAAGIAAFVFMPDDVPDPFIDECDFYGAKLELVDGLITDCAKKVAAGKDREGWFDVSTLKEPYRVEGKKTMGYELAEQFGWELPDVIIYPTGGGTGLIGMWKAFEEMEQLGWIGKKRPRMVSYNPPVARRLCVRMIKVSTTRRVGAHDCRWLARAPRRGRFSHAACYSRESRHRCCRARRTNRAGDL